MTEPLDLRGMLRGLPVFDVEIPQFDPDAAPTEPDDLFAEWLQQAIDTGVREPHAMDISTVDADGRPSSRVLILRALSQGRWGFATSRDSRKGIELDAQPWAALTFYWREVGRQVRVRGRVIDAGPEESARDFLARPAASKIESWSAETSHVLTSRGQLDVAADQARARIAADPRAVPEHWVRYDVLADEVEFWQADRDRRHLRLRYELRDGAWSREQLWP